MVSIVGLGENAVGEFLPVTPQRLAEGHHPRSGLALTHSCGGTSKRAGMSPVRRSGNETSAI